MVIVQSRSARLSGADISRRITAGSASRCSIIKILSDHPSADDQAGSPVAAIYPAGASCLYRTGVTHSGAQRALDHLADRISRQLVDELDHPRVLVGRKLALDRVLKLALEV